MVHCLITYATAHNFRCAADVASRSIQSTQDHHVNIKMIYTPHTEVETLSNTYATVWYQI